MTHCLLTALAESEMDFKDLVQNGFSLLTLFTSLVAIVFTSLQLKSSESTSYAQMLLDIDKQLIADPDLWKIFDVYADTSSQGPEDIKLKVKLKAFAYMHLNTFYLLHTIHEQPVRRILLWIKQAFDWSAKSGWNDEETYLRHMMQHSSLFHDTVAYAQKERLYPEKFLNELRKHAQVREESKPPA